MLVSASGRRWPSTALFVTRLMDILFKGLLFNEHGCGHVPDRQNQRHGSGWVVSDHAPLPAFFCMVGAASISAFPLFSGFVSKSMVMDAAASGTHAHCLVYFCCSLQRVCFTMRVSRFPILPFFPMIQECGPKRPPSICCSPWGLQRACVFLSVFIPHRFIRCSPTPWIMCPTTAPHVLGQTQLLFFSALGVYAAFAGGHLSG